MRPFLRHVVPLSSRHLWKRLLLIIAITVFATVSLLVVLLLLFQDRMIWLPRRYPADMLDHVPTGLSALQYRTDAGDQVAFVHAPITAGVDPAKAPLWVFIYGNAGLALEWAEEMMPAGATVLMVEYPGYGACAGAPSPAAMDASIEAALAAWSARCGHPVAIHGILGHSMGAAFALRLACRHPAQHVVLIAPYTSLRDMAQRAVGWPLCWLLRHNLDNVGTLNAVCAQTPTPAIDIFMDHDDEVIPVAMGRTLAATHPGQVSWHEVTGSGHNAILDVHLGDIVQAIR
jgi:pimeloyl-ACP methyl ester carboxylesterase